MYTSFISDNYSNVSNQDTPSYQTITVSDHSIPYTTVTNSSTDWATLGANVGGHITYLRRAGKDDMISTDDLITKQDLVDEEFLWQSLFHAICQSNPDKMPDYMTVFKLYKENYKDTVIAIETAKKSEIE